MRRFNELVQKREIALNAEEAAKVARSLDTKGRLILKSQKLAERRGKGIYKINNQLRDFIKQIKRRSKNIQDSRRNIQLYKTNDWIQICYSLYTKRSIYLQKQYLYMKVLIQQVNYIYDLFGQQFLKISYCCFYN
ncbi:unnamed protein product [Paramecium sonneborni]|uniref:Uncharacterized protein n=1 Tax=Paramecium sonneborni TaxID=65129 RepID=A0A8S1QNF5_9CILI|nr:unnamed protein product [Paramecium sonneborni]